jgi:hypothetical protein
MSEWTVPHRSDTVTDEAIFEDARRVVADLEYIPSHEEMHEHGKYSHRAYGERFDGYGAMLIRAGIVEEHPKTGRRPVPTETVLADIRRVRDDLGRWPKSYEYNDRGTYSWQLLDHRLDEGWAAIRARAEETEAD